MESTRGAQGTVFCTNCGYKLTAEDRFCPECGAERPKVPAPPLPPPPGLSNPAQYASSVSTPAAGSFASSMPFMSMAPVAADSNQPMLQYDVEYPDTLSRLLVLARVILSWLIVLPHYVVLLFLGLAVLVIWPISWFAILIMGRYPRGMWEFVVNTLRWAANVQVFYLGQRDEYPPFSGTAPYPVQFELAYPERLSRLLLFVKWLLVIPSVIIYFLIAIVASFAIFFGWVAVLFVGRFPRGLFDFVTGYARWGHRIAVYMLLLTDAYPPFRMGP